MIVRIEGDGDYRVADHDAERLDEFRAAHRDRPDLLAAEVRAIGTPTTAGGVPDLIVSAHDIVSADDIASADDIVSADGSEPGSTESTAPGRPTGTPSGRRRPFDHRPGRIPTRRPMSDGPAHPSALDDVEPVDEPWD